MLLICLWFCIAILLVSLSSLFLYSRIRKPNNSDRLVALFIAVLTIDIIGNLLFRVVWPEMTLRSSTAPFGLLYSPLFYAIWLSFSSPDRLWRRIWFHFLPFLAFFVVYLLFFISPSFYHTYVEFYFTLLYSVMCLFAICYGLFIYLDAHRKRHINMRFLRYVVVVQWIDVAFMLPGLLAWQGLSFLFSQSSMGIVIYSSLLVLALFSFFHLWNSWHSQGKFWLPALETHVDEGAELPVVEEDKREGERFLDRNSRRIQVYLDTKPYIDPGFNQSCMATELELSRQEVSAYFKEAYGQGFAPMVNSWRVAVACTLLEEVELELSMDELAYACGFNSRASFYRNFKLEKGCSPSEYRDRT